jgi:hypothetical protein
MCAKSSSSNDFPETARPDADDLLALALAIDGGAYIATPNVRVLARHYIELRTQHARDQQEKEQLRQMLSGAGQNGSAAAQPAAPVHRQQELKRMITADDLDNLRHMLGVSDECRRGYRNYFIAGGDDIASMERLREVGFVVKNERYSASADPCYHATLEGARALGLKGLPR